MTSDTTPEAVPKLLRYDDVAEALGVTTRTVRAIVRAGDLPFIRIGKQSVRFTPADLEAYIDRQRRGREVRR